MAKNQKTPRSVSKHSNKGVKANPGGSHAHTVSAASAVHDVTPTSERIIKETSVKRRKAMTVLANR